MLVHFAIAKFNTPKDRPYQAEYHGTKYDGKCVPNDI